MRRTSYDAVVVWAGPNGLAAAIVLARAGLAVLLKEAQEVCGGGARSAELTLPGFLHDICSAVHPLALSSPFFRTLPLSELGVTWIHSPAALAHPFDDNSVVLLHRSLDATTRYLGADAAAYRRLLAPFISRWEALQTMLLGPLKIPCNPILLARFGLRAMQSAKAFSVRMFKQETARGFSRVSRPIPRCRSSEDLVPRLDWFSALLDMQLGGRYRREEPKDSRMHWSIIF